jgi:protein-S-isoprenylcysteine O-methyltransferase Ste14
MDLDATFRPFVVAGFLLILLIVLPYRLRSRATGESLDRTQEGVAMMITLRVAGLVLWLTVLTFMIDPSRMAWAAMPLPASLRWSGAVLGVVAAMAELWTLRSLGPNLTDTVVTRQVHTLVTRGPYRWVRHPFYDCMALFTISVALMMANWLVLALGAVTFALLALRSRTEEQKLLDRFGQPYRAYQARTGRFLPRLLARLRLGPASRTGTAPPR